MRRTAISQLQLAKVIMHSTTKPVREPLKPQNEVSRVRADSSPPSKFKKLNYTVTNADVLRERSQNERTTN